MADENDLIIQNNFKEWIQTSYHTTNNQHNNQILLDVMR